MSSTNPASESERSAGGTSFEDLLGHVREQRGFDFTGYKRASLERRIERRMKVVGTDTYENYLDRLLTQPEELTALLDAVLINVTSFFRDPDAWDYLRDELLPPMLERRAGQPIRVWSAGCASGEEAYTVAIVLAELIGVDGVRDRVKVYATDVDEDALAHARQASYARADLDGLPASLRETYFEQAGERWVVRKELRRAVIFGRNDLVQDAPISHVDLLVCRNTLMYFTAETQRQVLHRMHFALRPDGVLFLGKAEMLLSHAASFRPIELKRRFFRTIAIEARQRRASVPASAQSVELGDPSRIERAALLSSRSAQLGLDATRRVAFVNHRAMNLLGLTERDVGRPIQDLELSYRPAELRSHIDEALALRHATWLRGVEMVQGSAGTFWYDIQLAPLSDETGSDLGLTITFEDVTPYRLLQLELEHANRELESASQELQSTVEELETTNEELQSTNEELETTNEELQSTNEELETMNEELQSTNDEVHETNEALRERQEEVHRLNRFTTSVLGSMNSGVAVVDQQMRILAWNARAEDLWGVRSDEAVGALLMDLDIGLPLERLRSPVREQLVEEPPGPRSMVLEAVNRRGRTLRVRVTLTDVRDQGEPTSTAMLVMEVVEVMEKD